jgi:PAS domain S-box-containing protein
MATKLIHTQRYKLSALALFLTDNLAKFAKINYPASSGLDKYYERLLTLIESYNEIILDENGTILTWSKDFERMNGYHELDIIGKSYSLFYLPEERDSKLPEKLLDTAKTRGIATHFGQYVRKDGGTFWGNIKIVAIKKGSELLGYTAYTRMVKNKELAL